MSYIRFENINKSFGSNHVLKDINLEVEKGRLVTLLGPSGCGKSTLLRCLAGLEQVSDGHIYLDGQEITDIVPRKRGIGMVFQQYSLFPNKNVRDNVAYGLKLKKMPKAQIQQKVEEMLDIVGLSDKIDQYPSSLSGGQQQRVALARAMVTAPKVLLLDEPLSAIDALLRKNLQIEIRRIQQQLGITTIFVTHDQDEAMVMSDMIHLFHDGRIEQSGTPEQIYTSPATKFAATFIGNYNLLKTEDFNRIFRADLPGNDVAVRPEIVQLGRTDEKENPRELMAEGIIVNHIPHGSLIRYQVDCQGISLNADVVFEKQMEFHEGDHVFVRVDPDLVIRL
ncbi:MAG: ABC transporter ATP-binding protein [Parasporobacterium sp.]|nr:ABC transporter ATP-binding protein [Parasporobacterium sp.]